MNLNRENHESVLELFPGAGIFGKGFEDSGYCVVRGPDLITGGDVRRFKGKRNLTDGVIGGPPCQNFSLMNRSRDPEKGLAMLAEFERIVLEIMPKWFLMENVASVPDMKIDGYTWQRIDIRSSEFGLKNRRLRHFQFGSRLDCNKAIVLEREDDPAARDPIVFASNHAPHWSKFLEAQGLPSDFDLPCMTLTGKKTAIGNAVAYPVAIAFAEAIKNRVNPADVRLCICGCARMVKGRSDKKVATDLCRKTLSNRRKKYVN